MSSACGGPPPASIAKRAAFRASGALKSSRGGRMAAALTAVPFGFIHLPLAFLNEITLASVLISLAAYILLGLFLRPLVGVVLRGSRDSLLAAGLMHSVFNRTNNDNGIAAALLNGELYRLGILIAVVVLIAALALLAGRRRLTKAYRLELDANPGGVARWPTTNPSNSSRPSNSSWLR
jgi:uncharacterized protein